MFYERFAGKSMSLIILDNDYMHGGENCWDWKDPLDSALIVCHVGEQMYKQEADGTRDNVVHKLRFVLRTSLNSVIAESRPDLVRVGDFPWGGAGTYRNWTGGVSGLTKEQDWEMFCLCTEKLIRLLGAVNSKAMAQAKQALRQPLSAVGTKYLLHASLEEAKI